VQIKDAVCAEREAERDGNGRIGGVPGVWCGRARHTPLVQLAAFIANTFLA
jgi:hypothetical protein